MRWTGGAVETISLAVCTFLSLSPLLELRRGFLKDPGQRAALAWAFARLWPYGDWFTLAMLRSMMTGGALYVSALTLGYIPSLIDGAPAWVDYVQDYFYFVQFPVGAFLMTTLFFFGWPTVLVPEPLRDREAARALIRKHRGMSADELPKPTEGR